MATRLKGKPSKSLFGDEDILDSLFDDPKLPVRKAARGGPLNRNSATDNIFSKLAEEVKRDGGSEDSDVSAADPSDILKNMKDMDDMDADLFASKKKPSSAPAQTKPFGNEGPKKDSTLESKVKPEGADEPTAGGRKPNSAPASTSNNYRKFNFSDLDDPLADFLDDLLPDEPKPKSTKPEKPVPSPSAHPIVKTETPKAGKKQSLTFDDDKDDLMDTLEFDNDKNSSKKKEGALWSNKEPSVAPQRPRTKLDEILESMTPSSLLERPPTGEKKDQEKQQQEKTSIVKEDDLTFGSYQPTLGSTPEGRQSRRQSVRFSTEDGGPSTPERTSKASTSRHRNSADWLGLKTDDDHTLLAGDATQPSEAPPTERRSSLTGSHATSAPALNDTKQTKAEVSKSQQRDEEEDDWLAGALSRKKALSTSNPETKASKQDDSSGQRGDADLESAASKQVTSLASRGREDTLTSVKETSTFLEQPSPTAHSTPKEARTKRDCSPHITGPSPASAASISTTQTQLQSQPHHPPSHTGSRIEGRPGQALDETPPMLSFLRPNHMQNTPTAVQQQVTFPADSLQQLLLQQQMMQSQLLGLGGVGAAGVLQRQQQPGDYQDLQTRIIQLEGQVKTLQIEREQSQALLENVQQRHKQDTQLLENTHK